MNGVGGSEAIRRRGGGCCGRGRRAVCCSFVLNLVVVVLLTAAASSPWYATSSRHVPPTSGALVTTTDRLLLWYWSGLSIHTTSTSAYAPSVPTPTPNTTASIAATNSALVQVMTTMTTTANHMKAVASVSSAGWPVVFHEAGDGTSTSWETIGWDDRRYGLGAAKSIYSASNAMALVGLGFALLLALFLFYGVASCPGPRMTFHRHYTHCKSFISCLSALTFVFTCLAWGLFLYFPTALGNRCVPKFTCDMFFGSASQRNNNPPELLEAVWSPFVGWALALLSTPFAFLALVVACFVQKPPPPARDYRLVIN